MLRARCTALVAAIVIVLVAAFSATGLAGGHAPAAFAQQLPWTAPEERPLSVSDGTDAELSFTAVELGRAPLVIRAESRQASRALSFALLAVLLLLAGIGRRGVRVRHLLELSIRSRTDWWRPIPGGRAPPRVQTL